MAQTEIRKGRQTPTKSIVLPYTRTRGAEAISLYNSSGRTAQEWQELLIYDIMAVNEDGLWVHTKVGEEIPRRNGKNEVVVIREMWGLENSERILHTAHRTTTSTAASRRLAQRLVGAGYEEVTRVKKGVKYGKHFTYTKQLGLERIVLLGEGGGTIDFRTRSSQGGLGEGFDLLVIDEAQEYTDNQETALKYVVTDSKNPQTIFCGTPPTVVSAGTVFMKMRSTALQGERIHAHYEPLPGINRVGVYCAKKLPSIDGSFSWDGNRHKSACDKNRWYTGRDSICILSLLSEGIN